MGPFWSANPSSSFPGAWSEAECDAGPSARGCREAAPNLFPELSSGNAEPAKPGRASFLVIRRAVKPRFARRNLMESCYSKLKHKYCKLRRK